MTPLQVPPVQIIGAGLAGTEAALQLASRGIPVELFEMRPHRTTEAHTTEQFAELVCSNSLKSKDPHSAPGILKTEMCRLGSFVLQAASDAEVPSGQALGVDRDQFAHWLTQKTLSHPLIQVRREEVQKPDPQRITLIATGPLTSPALSEWLAQSSSQDDLYFYDAIAPIVDAQSIDMDKAFFANRYDKGEEEAYLNCPLSQGEYEAFIDALLAAEKVAPKNFEKEKFFAGCQPIEAIAETGRDSLRFGPMKPVGLTDPRTGRWAYACVQLRPENRAKTAYNLVGFQTKLKYGEQSRIFKMIPALHRAEFLRLGSIHRNTYVCAPKVLSPDLSLRGKSKVYLAGQITGVEGYLESAATGLLASIFIEQRVRGWIHSAPPANTALGALLRHLALSDPKNYQPANIHFGLFDPVFFQNKVSVAGAEQEEDLVQKGVRAAKKEELKMQYFAQSPIHLENWLKTSMRPFALEQEHSNSVTATDRSSHDPSASGPAQGSYLQGLKPSQSSLQAGDLSLFQKRG